MSERLFARPLYAEDAIRAAANAYAEVAQVTIASTETGWVVAVDDDLADDFANHVLHETITRRRR